METFPILRQRDEVSNGEYRIKLVILEIYDETARAIETGQSYQTRLDPPPGGPQGGASGYRRSHNIASLKHSTV